jgi:hypothetical protein
MAPAALIWLYHNRAIDRKHAWNGLRQVCARSAADQGKILPVALNARWIAMGPFSHWCAWLFWLYLITTLIGDDSSVRHRNIAWLVRCESMAL